MRTPWTEPAFETDSLMEATAGLPLQTVPLVLRNARLVEVAKAGVQFRPHQPINLCLQ